MHYRTSRVNFLDPADEFVQILSVLAGKIEAEQVIDDSRVSRQHSAQGAGRRRRHGCSGRRVADRRNGQLRAGASGRGDGENAASHDASSRNTCSPTRRAGRADRSGTAVVWSRGFEPLATRIRGECSTKLSYDQLSAERAD